MKVNDFNHNGANKHDYNKREIRLAVCGVLFVGSAAACGVCAPKQHYYEY